METKICTECNKNLPMNMFCKKSATKDGLQTRCRTCRNKKQKQYRADNAEKLKESAIKYYEENKIAMLKQREEYRKKNVFQTKESARKYHIKNKDRIAKYNKNRYEENFERMSAVAKIYRDANKDKIRERSRKYSKLNREKRIASTQKYRANKRLLPSTLTVEQWKLIKLHFNNRCAYCNERLPLAQEHFLALSKGGEYTTNNIIPSCKECNSSKGTKDFFIWYKSYKYYNKAREIKILKYLNYKNNIQQLTFVI